MLLSYITYTGARQCYLLHIHWCQADTQRQALIDQEERQSRADRLRRERTDVGQYLGGGRTP